MTKIPRRKSLSLAVCKPLVIFLITLTFHNCETLHITSESNNLNLNDNWLKNYLSTDPWPTASRKWQLRKGQRWRFRPLRTSVSRRFLSPSRSDEILPIVTRQPWWLFIGPRRSCGWAVKSSRDDKQDYHHSGKDKWYKIPTQFTRFELTIEV